MEQKIALALMIFIVGQYLVYMYAMKKIVRKQDQEPVDLSVPTYKPRIKQGLNDVVLTKIGKDYDSTLAIVNRYAPSPRAFIVEGEVILSDVDVYTAEDLLDELRYIGSDGEIKAKTDKPIIY